MHQLTLFDTDPPKPQQRDWKRNIQLLPHETVYSFCLLPGEEYESQDDETTERPDR